MPHILKLQIYHFLAKLFFKTFIRLKHLSDYRTVRLSHHRTIGLSDCRIIATAPLKALLKFKKSFNLYKPKIKTLLHIFDHTVKPVLLYGSEVWGTSMVNKINKEERFLFNLSKNMKQENVHIKLCKFSLDVGKRTTNIAVLEELGR